MTWWTLKAWPWLVANWKWLLFPIGIIVFILGYSVRKRPEVLAPELLEHAKETSKIEKRTAGQIVEAKEERDRKIKEIEKEHANTVAKLTRKQRDELEGLREDPDKLADFLKQVGKDIRG